MAICSFFLEGRCRFGDRCWNEHPTGSRQWTSQNQRYVQPSSFSKSMTWSRDNSQPSFPSHSDSYDNRSRQYDSGASASNFSSQNRFSNLSSQTHARETQSDKDGNLFEDIKQDLDVWESSGQWIFSAYCVIKDLRNLTGFADISPEELRLECYTARDSGNMQNYVNSVQQLASQWKQRIHTIRNTNISPQAALMNELTKPATGSVPVFGGDQNSAFSTTISSTSNAAPSANNFSFKPDSQYTAPSAGPVSSTSVFGSKPATGFSNAVTGSAASFTFAVTTASDGASSLFGNPNAVTAATFSFAPTTSSGVGASAFSGFTTATTALPASTSSAITSVFGGTTGVSDFGQSAPSVFGSVPSNSGFGVPAGNTVTSGFGGKTSAVSELFRTGAASSATTAPFGQLPAVSVSRMPSVTAEASSENPIFTARAELTDKELSQFEAIKFTIGNIPLRPPPANLLAVK
ncbi:PREDICTED: nucleoporin-like protein 2 [Nanorana parkeri]|uniref:nucleoporin-like protein 2 n=1 Tax=Nanorana parkeri TaxID=125878 RepID=UPI000854E593|nr:PREDICTED: nucleoporin-like protein 2 [Nanorana parkeri]